MATGARAATRAVITNRWLSLPTALRASVFAALWWLLADGAVASWIVGVPGVAAATWVSGRLANEPAALSPVALLRFAPLFAWESLRGGVDVAARVLAPRMSVRPGFMYYRCRLQQPAARVFFANCVSLLPGTLVAAIRDDQLELHLLDAGAEPNDDLARIEHAVAAIFGESPGAAS